MNAFESFMNSLPDCMQFLIVVGFAVMIYIPWKRWCNSTFHPEQQRRRNEPGEEPDQEEDDIDAIIRSFRDRYDLGDLRGDDHRGRRW